MTDRVPTAPHTGGADGSAWPPLPPILVIGVSLLAEIALAAAGGFGLLGSIRLLVVHLALVGMMVVGLWRTILSGTDGGTALLAVLATLATGPFGAAGALIIPPLARKGTDDNELLVAWYRRIALSAEQDEFTRLSDHVAMGRSANLAAPPPQVFDALFGSGSIGAQQSALGLIARAFHPRYLPALKLALESPEPVIRVQAAAVAARVRGPLSVRVHALLARAADPRLSAEAAMETAGELDLACGSSLLDEKGRLRAAAIRDGLMARTMASLDAVPRDGAARPRGSAWAHAGDGATDGYEAFLLARGRFAEFRALRLAHRRPLTGRYRRRTVALRPPNATLRLTEVRRDRS